ncbi:unnamed protein product [Haemonchus placei]|uniref:Transposase n=1 Tax=Haemonchus placei TaxID=6290 RepID=A0A0N4WIF1_HAEPC|nr:unnamed protein product [Haemonchus placei]
MREAEWDSWCQPPSKNEDKGRRYTRQGIEVQVDWTDTLCNIVMIVKPGRLLTGSLGTSSTRTATDAMARLHQGSSGRENAVERRCYYCPPQGSRRSARRHVTR